VADFFLKCLVRPAAVFALAVLSLPASAQTFSPEFRTLGLGQTASELNATTFENFACGTNGGLPGQSLTGFADYAQCPPEEGNGFREVYVEYNTTNNPISRSFRERNSYEDWLPRYGLTRMASFPVVLSVLFDETGVVRVFRVVSETRALPEERERAHLLANRVMPNYGEDWTCVDTPPAAGEGPVGFQFINRVCNKTMDGKLVHVEQRYLTDPAGAIDAYTRWEVFDASLPPEILPD
jgi:hypothetical protein